MKPLPRRKKRYEASPATIGTLAEDGSLETIVSLAIRIGNPPFDRLSEDKEGIREGIAILHKMWPKHHEAATRFCIERFGSGVRPALWWIHDCPEPGRPHVEPRNWYDSNDAPRFARERAAADLAFLEKHKLLTVAEKAAFAEMRKEKHFGPATES